MTKYKLPSEARTTNSRSCFLRMSVSARHLCEQGAFEPNSHGVDFHSIKHVVREAVGQHASCFLDTKAARSQIVNCVFIQMPDGCAVRALDVVGIYLELRLAVDGRLFGEHQVLIALSSIGLLSVLAYNDAAVEDGARF